MRIVGFDHVQLAMPAGREAEARAFYDAILGIPERVKPPELAKRGGCWFERGSLRLHLGVEADFRPARKAHPALIVEDLPSLRAALEKSGHRISTDAELADFDRIFVDDPFGNRIELMEPKQR
ncbi:MAG: glyoxalase [Proteobacteria bacterium]|nr:glyoxalase [Pseudomonadota bacterium]